MVVYEGVALAIANLVFFVLLAGQPLLSSSNQNPTATTPLMVPIGTSSGIDVLRVVIPIVNGNRQEGMPVSLADDTKNLYPTVSFTFHGRTDADNLQIFSFIADVENIPLTSFSQKRTAVLQISATKFPALTYVVTNRSSPPTDALKIFTTPDWLARYRSLPITISTGEMPATNLGI